MNAFKRAGALLLVPALAVTLAACDDDDAEITEPELGTIVEELQADASFGTLVDAVVQADLAETLSAPGPFTVFAPLDAAFDRVPADDLNAILADQERLTGLLTYHVVPGEFDAAAALEAGVLTTVNGQKLLVTEEGGDVFVDGARVFEADREATNGLIHVVEDVLIPAERNVVEIAQASEDFSTLVAAVVEAELAGTLSGEGPFTIFAPTNAAFSALPDGTLDALLADVPALTDVLTYHVVAGRLMSPEVVAAGELTTLQGQTLPVEVVDGQVRVGGAAVIAVDVQGTNGVIHVIDQVLVPGS